MLIEFELFQVIISEGQQNQVIVVKEKGGERFFPIYIGHNEATAIHRKLHDVQVPRPLTHDLLYNLIEQMGGKLTRVVINAMREDYYLALLDIRRGGDMLQVDARPSDAIALAVRANVPIYVEEEVLNALQTRGS